ncbi:MAG: extracellular solute-binding protein [Eubacteriales bacterium]
MKKKLISVLLVSAMTMGLIAGCGSSTDSTSTDTSSATTETESTTAESTTAESTEVESDASIYEARTVTVYLNGIDEEKKMQDAMAEIQTMEKYQNITFNFVGRDADYDTKMPTEVAGGVEIDLVICANPINLTSYAESGLLLPLDDIITASGHDFSTEFGDYASAAVRNDSIYMIPNNVTSWAITYNKDVFDAAGLDYPSTEIPMTWDEYAEVAKSITSGSGADKTYGAFYINWGTYTYGEAIMALGGGEYFYNDEGLSNIEDPAFATALEGVYNMMHVDGSMQTHANLISTSTQVTDFMNGKYGMSIAGGWYLSWCMDQENYPRDWTVGIAPMPVDEGTETKTWGVVNGLGVPVSAPDPELSVEVAYDLVSLAAKYADTTASAIQTVDQSNLFVDAAAALADEGITVELLTDIYANPDIYVTEKISGANSVAYESVYMEEVEKYLVQEQDLETTITNIKERGDAAILGN